MNRLREPRGHHSCPGVRAALRGLGLVVLILANPLAAKESLGVFGQWGAFRDAQPPRCYAIAAARENGARRDFAPFASVGTWPRHEVRGQVHFRLSRALRQGARIALRVDNRSFTLDGGGSDVWAPDRQADAAIVAAMRSGGSMQISTVDASGRRFTDRYSLEGAATALDAASVGCSMR